MKRLLRFLDAAFITLQAIFALTAVVVTEVLNQQNLHLTFIEALLAMIVIDFFILFSSRWRVLTRSTEEIARTLAHRGIGVEFVERHTFDWRTAVASARHDVFISGTTLTGFVAAKDLFAGLNRRVQVRFLVLNVGDLDVLEGFRRMRYSDSERHSQQRYLNQANLFKDLYIRLRDSGNIQFAVSDRIMPMAFIAIDVNRLSENSLIRVQHYLHENEADQATVSYVVRPGNPTYTLYASQIKILWDAGLKQNTYLDAS
ncbi:hypothetical protein [Micromonospora sp. CA-246542]|uniref:hypothetical protein n=1 Tax=Micromonospora sp. CA-246542 TaxID=3239959 RepID=UPI003D909B12